ncbi:reverse transcriptase family protein [Vibrio lentus]
MNNKKLTTEALISILCDDAHESNELLKKPIPPYIVKDVTESQIGSKTVFKLIPAKAQYQKRLNEHFFSKIPINNSAIAYVKNKSYLDMFEPHKNSYHFLRIDIKSFFHSIDRDLLKETLSSHISDDIFYKNGKVQQTLIDAVLNILTLNLGEDFKDKDLNSKEVLPIGFHSSPVVSNIVFRKFDFLIQKLCSKNNIIYTRYADDMFFSSNADSTFLHSDHFINEVSYILSLGNFKLNHTKTLKEKNMISLNGYVIESKGKNSKVGSIRLSNKKTERICKIINKLDQNITHKDILKKVTGLRERDIRVRYTKGKNQFISQYYKSQIINLLAGYRAYLLSIIKFNHSYNCVEFKYIEKYEKIIDKLQKHLLRLM